MRRLLPPPPLLPKLLARLDVAGGIAPPSPEADPAPEGVLAPPLYCMGGHRSLASLSDAATPKLTPPTPLLEPAPLVKKPTDLMLPPGDMTSSPPLATPPEEDATMLSSGADMVANSPPEK